MQAKGFGSPLRSQRVRRPFSFLDEAVEWQPFFSASGSPLSFQ